MEEKTGTITDIVFRNDENGYTVAVMETETEYFTVVGNLPQCVKGSRFRLTGIFKNHPTYGEQFAFKEFEEIMPDDSDAIFDFLSSGIIRGVGKATARLLVRAFGDDTMRILEEEPQKLISVRGIGPKTAEKITQSYGEHRQFAAISVKLQGYGVTTAAALKLFRMYGQNAAALIEENPYRLVEEVRGFGFRKADAIAEKMGIESSSPFRIRSGIRYVLSYFAGEGNTYMPRTELCESAGELLDLPAGLIMQEIIGLAFNGIIKLDRLDGEEVCYLYPLYIAEQQVTRSIARISSGSLKPLSTDKGNMIRQMESDTGLELSEQQKRAVNSSVSCGLSVITGGPGTGKTTIINAMIRIFKQSGLSTAIAAPTGRAAKRIAETSGHYASTIHRLLEYFYYDEADEMRFGRTQDDPLDYDVIIVDEASMIDLMLMQGLTGAVRTGTRLILIGDADQLPSVGAGNVLRDLIESGCANVTRLTDIFRQAEESLIVVNAHKINNGEYPSYNEKDKDFFFMERRSENEILDLIIELASKRLASYYGEIDTLKDIQVLTPVRKGLLGTVSLNTALQQALNPPAPGKNERRNGERIFREGDKVMQIKNNYMIGWRKRRDMSEGQGIFNGDVGTIQRIDHEDQTVTVVFDDERFVTYDFSGIDELELAYAVTVHKSQGSEFPIVVMPISWFPPVLATRNLLYTAVTRGKMAVVLCGSIRRLEAMVDNNRIRMRYSGLGKRLHFLNEMLEADGPTYTDKNPEIYEPYRADAPYEIDELPGTDEQPEIKKL